MYNILNQAFVEVNIIKKKPIEMPDAESLVNASDFFKKLEERFDKTKYPNIDYFLFLCDSEAGKAKKGKAICFANRNETTIPHELLHSIGLRHTFTNKVANRNAKYTYRIESTNNIMDYSNKRNHLFYWQCQLLKKLLKKK